MTAVTEACPEADVSVQKELLLEVSALLSETKVALSALQQRQAEGIAISGAEGDGPLL